MREADHGGAFGELQGRMERENLMVQMHEKGLVFNERAFTGLFRCISEY